MKRYIAIDNKCLWPNLTVFADGSIGAVGFNEPCHGTRPGEVQAWISNDGGRIWTARDYPVPHKEGEVRMNHSAGLGLDGEWLCAVGGYGGWTQSPASEEDVRDYVLTYSDYWDSLSRLTALVARSYDQGITWETFAELPHMEGWCPLVPFGKIQTGNDGRLRMFSYSLRTNRDASTRQAFFLRSRNGGATWEVQSQLPSSGTTETAAIHLGNGMWIAAARRIESYGGEILIGYRSMDDGETWTRGEVLGIRDSFPAWFLMWNDRLLLFHGNRAVGRGGIDVRIFDSQHGGWTSPRRLVDLGGDLGYPSAVVNSAGELVLAYYSSHVPDHQRYHMGVLITTPDEFGLNDFPCWAETSHAS